MGGSGRRRRVGPTDEWEQIELLCGWPEQRDYELIRPLVLFGASADGRSRDSGAASGRTLQRRAKRFDAEGMESHFGSGPASRKRLPPAPRRLILDLKAEHPALNPNEIANIVRACFGRKPDVRSVRRVLDEEPMPLRIVRNYPPYREIADPPEGRAAIVELRLSGWSAKAIASYLEVHKATVYRALNRWKDEGFEGLADRSPGRPPGVRKADFAAVEAIRKLAKNPGLGAFRVHAALLQMGFDLSRATCGRILAQVRELYGYEKPRGGGRPPRAMPFAASGRHEVWSADVRHLDMVDEGPVGSKAYSVTVMDNYSRAILSSAVTRRQDLSAFLSVFYRAVERHGAPQTLVTDSGSVFLSNRAKVVYAKLGVSKEEIEKGRPWQNFSETTFGVQQRMADWHFGRAESWAELVGVHDRFVRDYNAQPHFAHQKREDGRRSPAGVLSWVSGMRFHPEDLERAFFSERFSRVLDGSGYATLMRWRLYAEEGLAGEEAELWLLENTLTVEHAGEPLSAYEVGYDAAGGRSGAGRLLEVGKPALFETSHALGQMRLFGLAETLGEDGWLKALRLDDYAPRSSRRPTCCSRSSSPTRTPSKEPDAATSAAMPATAMRRRVYESVCPEAPPVLGRGCAPQRKSI